MKHCILLLLFLQAAFAQDVDSNKDQFRNRGYFNLTRIGYISVNNVERDYFVPGEGNFSIDVQANNARAYLLETINGYFFNPYFSAGIGVGLNGYHEPTLNTMPVFIDVRGYLNNSYNSPFIYADYGVLIRPGDIFKRGNMFNIGAGYKFFISKSSRIALVPEIGYSMKNISLTDEAVRTSDDSYNLTGLHFGLGIIF